ncbi:MAG: tyrosine--tRNA ligase [Candidatus Peregrinibacteria bacterium]|nr:tyrosine--tRNA ligase [Candidatus Peregrinibacteria bacterium]
MNVDEILSRGVDSIVPKKGLKEKMESGKKLRLYLGVDPTGAQIHLGHTIPLRKLRDFQRAGHQVIFLVGSFTAMIGDPTDRSAMRQPLTQAEIEKNFHTYKEQASKIIDFSKAEIVYNGDWLSKLSFTDVVELAQKFTVQQMLERDMYQKRVAENKPIGLHEFFYPLMQGYDSVHLEVDLEVGGTDQLFNMLAGRHLLEVYKGKEKHVLTTPLIEGTDGRKMSKTYSNTINISDAPSDMFGKVMSMTDDLIIKYFIYCTDLSIKEIDAIDKAMKAGENPRDAKMKLAAEIVKLYHSEAEAAMAEQDFVNVFKKGGVPEDMPEFEINGERNIIDLLELCRLVTSKSEGRRAVEQGGVKINEKKVESVDEVIHLEKDMIIQLGKRRFAKII